VRRWAKGSRNALQTSLRADIALQMSLRADIALQMSSCAAVCKGLPQRTIDVFPRCGVSPWPLRAYSLDGLGLDAIRDINSLVRADRQPALGLRQRRAHSHVDTQPLCRLSVSTLPVASASSRDSIDECQRSSPLPWVTTPTVSPAL
jgi:hypothetical protein